MDKPIFKVWRVGNQEYIPEKSHSDDVGWDLRASEEISLREKELIYIPLDLIIKPPPGYYVEVFPRSSLFKKFGVLLVNSVGIIDPGYCGPKDKIGAFVYKPSYSIGENVIKRGDRILQVVPKKIEKVEFVDMTSSPFENNSRGGWGSSGIK